MDDRRIYIAALGLLTAFLGYLVYLIVKPFLVPLAWAAVLAVLFCPLHAFALRYLKRRHLTALLSTTIIMGLIIGPVTVLSVLLAQELKTLAEALRAGRISVLSGLAERPEIAVAFERVTAFFAAAGIDWNRTVADGIMQFGQDAAARLTRGVRDILGAFLGLGITAFSTFFLLRDGPVVLEKTRDLLPRGKRKKRGSGALRIFAAPARTDSAPPAPQSRSFFPPDKKKRGMPWTEQRQQPSPVMSSMPSSSISTGLSPTRLPCTHGPGRACSTPSSPWTGGPKG